jgi:hypothetical protein
LYSISGENQNDIRPFLITDLSASPGPLAFLGLKIGDFWAWKDRKTGPFGE